MGFASIASQVIFLFLFIIVIGAAHALIIQNTEQIDDSNRIRHQIDAQRLQTHITLEATFNPPQFLYLVVTNEGKTILNPLEFDIYINNERYERDNGELQLTYIVDTANPRLLDPGDSVEIFIRGPLPSGYHRAKVTTPTGMKAEAIFSVG